MFFELAILRQLTSLKGFTSFSHALKPISFCQNIKVSFTQKISDVTLCQSEWTAWNLLCATSQESLHGKIILTLP